MITAALVSRLAFVTLQAIPLVSRLAFITQRSISILSNSLLQLFNLQFNKFLHSFFTSCLFLVSTASLTHASWHRNQLIDLFYLWLRVLRRPIYDSPPRSQNLTAGPREYMGIR